MAWMRKDAALRWELAQIDAAGPNWREQQEALAQSAQAAGGGLGGGLGGGMGQSQGSSEFPSFGTPGAETAEAPNVAPGETAPAANPGTPPPPSEQ